MHVDHRARPGDIPFEPRTRRMRKVFAERIPSWNLPERQRVRVSCSEISFLYVTTESLTNVIIIINKQCEEH